jgi:predicted small lipoprotein YifL
MTKSLLIASLLAISLAACGKKEAPAPVAPAAPAAEPAKK